MSNSYSGGGGRSVYSPVWRMNKWEAFERLPAEVREALREAPYDYDPRIFFMRSWKRCSPMAMVQHIRIWSRDDVARNARKDARAAYQRRKFSYAIHPSLPHVQRSAWIYVDDDGQIVPGLQSSHIEDMWRQQSAGIGGRS